MKNLAIVTTLLLCACSKPAAPPVPAPPEKSSETPAAPLIETIATGANIAGANGIHFGPDDNLYVASVVGSDITVLNPDTGEEIRRYTAADGVLGPDDVAFAADGSIYWTSILVGEVAGLRPDGTKVVATQLPPGPNPITFSDDGRLFVSQCFLGTNLYELDPAGIEEPRVISDSLGPGCGLNGMDWGPDDRLYGPRWFVGEVVSFDVDTGEMRVEATGFQTPAAVKFNSEGELHVLDTGQGQVLKVTETGNELVAQLTPGLDNFAFDKNDVLFVSSFADGFVTRVNADGTKTRLQPGGMSHPGGVVIIDDRAVVADIHAIRGFDLDSGEETLTQRNVVGVGEMGGAINLSADGENLILSSWFDGDVRIWNPTTQTRVAHYPGLAAPVAAVRYGDLVVVAEHGKQRVVGLGNDGAEADAEITFARELPAPTGLVVHAGNLYVSDRELGQIMMIGQGGRPLAQPTVVVSNLTTPEGFVVTDSGFIVVEADAGTVTAVNAAGDRDVLANIPVGTQAGSPAQPPSQVFNGIARAPDGRLFVTGETNRVLYRITPPEQ